MTARSSPGILLPDRRVHVSRRQYLRRIGSHSQVVDPGRHIVESVVDAWWNDYDIAGADLPLLRRRLERALEAGANDDLHDIAVGSGRLCVDDFATGEKRATARDDVVDLGDLLVHDGADWSARLRRRSTKHTDAD